MPLSTVSLPYIWHLTFDIWLLTSDIITADIDIDVAESSDHSDQSPLPPPPHLMSWFPVWGYLHGTEARSLFVYSQSITVFPLRLNDYVATTLRLIIFVWIRSESGLTPAVTRRTYLTWMASINPCVKCVICVIILWVYWHVSWHVTWHVVCCQLYSAPIHHPSYISTSGPRASGRVWTASPALRQHPSTTPSLRPRLGENIPNLVHSTA